MPETIYSQRDAFFLEINGMDFKIREPGGWDKAQISIERDEKKHGLTVNFPHKDLQLEFGLTPESETGNRSKILIDDAYAQDGPDANVFIKFGLYDGVSITTLYTRRRLDLTDDVSKGLYTTTCKTIKDDIEVQVEDAKDIPVNLEQDKTIFNNTIPGITPAPKSAISLHSKALRQVYRAETQAKVIESELLTDTFGEPIFTIQDDEIGYGQIEFPNVVRDGVVDDQGLPTGFSEFDPEEISRGNFITINPSTVYRNVKVDKNILIKYRKSGVEDDLEIRVYLSIADTTFLIDTIPFTSFGALILEQVRIEASLDFDFPADTDSVGKSNEIFLYYEIDCTNATGPLKIASVEVYEEDKASFFELTADTFFKPSIVEGFRLYDALDYMFRAVFEEEDRFKSSIYDIGGQASDLILNNGNKIRGLNDVLKAPVLTIEDSFDALNMMHGIGESYEIDSGGTKQIVWERIDHFYRDVEIIDLSQNTSNYEEIGDKSFFPNLVSFQYPRLTVREDEGANTIDEYNSEIDISVPITRTDQKYRLKSNWRLSGYDAETSRRLSVKPTESYRSDDDIFLFHTKNALNITGIKMIFLYSDNDDENQLYIYFRKQDFEDEFKFLNAINVSGDSTPTASDNINGTYDYNSTIFIHVNTGTPAEDFIRVSATAGPGVTFDGSFGTAERENLSVTTSTFRAERNQDFDIVNGVIDPPSAYNLRAHPLRAFVNHGLIFNSSLFYKPDTTLFKVQFKKENRDLETQLNSSDSSPLGDTGFVIISEPTGIQKQNVDQGRYLYEPIRVKFKADIDFDKLLVIMNAVKYQDDTKLNGYITTINNEGETVKVWPDKIEGLPNENFYEIEGKIVGNYYD